MNKENPEINPEEITEVSTLAQREHEIILYNDEVNTFDHVIECLINICARRARGPGEYKQSNNLYHLHNELIIVDRRPGPHEDEIILYFYLM